MESLEPNPSVRGRGDTLLRNPEGFMCCLGQVACQLGATKEEILGKPEPVWHENSKAMLFHVGDGVLAEQQGNYANEERWDNTGLSKDAMEINDNASLLPEDREKLLADLFAKEGHEIEFVGEYVLPE